MTTALVTGATGFLGSGLARALCAAGRPVRVLVRATSDRTRLAGLSVEVVEGDVTDRASVAAALDGADAVFHAAAVAQLGSPDAEQVERVNVGGTAAVLEEAAARDVRAVHVSSVVALGPTGDEPADESHWNDVPPRSSYEASKRKAHLLARRLAAAGAPVRIGMPGGIYGPDDPTVMGTVIRWLLRHPNPVAGLRTVRQSTVHIDDCSDGLVRIADRGADGEEYLMCAESVTFEEWFEAIADAAGRRRPVAYLPAGTVLRLTPALVPLGRLFGMSPATVREVVATAAGASYSFSGDKARRELGWDPRPLARGMAELAEVELRSASPNSRRAAPPT